MAAVLPLPSCRAGVSVRPDEGEAAQVGTDHKDEDDAQDRGGHDEDAGAEEEEEADFPPDGGLDGQDDRCGDGHDAHVRQDVHDQGWYQVDRGLRLADFCGSRDGSAPVCEMAWPCEAYLLGLGRLSTSYGKAGTSRTGSS